MKLPGLKKFSRALTAAAKKDTPLNAFQIVGLSALLLLLSLFFTLLFSGYSRFDVPRYSAGDIARFNIEVPSDVFIEDPEATEFRRAQAREDVLPAYRHDTSRAERAAARLAQAFAKGRGALGSWEGSGGRTSSRLRLGSLPRETRRQVTAEITALNPDLASDAIMEFLVGERFNAELEQEAGSLLKEAGSSLIVADEHALIRGKSNIQVSRSAWEPGAVTPLARVATLDQSRARLVERIAERARYPSAQRPALAALISGLLEPNLAFDLQATRAQQERAAANVDSVLRLLKKGKIIARQGDELTSEQLSQIEAIRHLSLERFSVRQASGRGLLIAALLMVFGYVLRPLARPHWSYVKLVALCSMLLAGNIVLLKVGWFICESLSRNFVAAPFSDKAYFFFALPFAAGTMLVTLLIGERAALTFAIFCSVLSGLAVESDFYGFFYILMSNLVGNLTVRAAVQRVNIVGAGFKLGLAGAGLFVILEIARQTPLDLLAVGFGGTLAFLSGVISSGLVVFALPLCEGLFLVTTNVRLLELGNVNLPVIRELILKAPGTYNHSVAVGTLCEGAAKVVGLNPMFMRVASLYHDIGKSVRAEYFVENQRGFNIHDRLTPLESVQGIRSHVEEGIRMAREAKIPPNIADMIPQHHGTKLMTYFYEKTTKEAGPGGSQPDEADFRYPGPKPQSKEAAILMLADAVEASARTLQNHSQEKVLELIQKIVSSTVEDGQFSECDITLAEIDRIAFSFLETLSSIYHSRITYPAFDFNQIQPPRDAGATVR